jgi:hypothetical protein
MKKAYIFLAILALTFSCERDDSYNQEVQQIQDKIEVENGILSFSSKDFLDRTVKDLKESNKDEKIQKLNKFYVKGFMPLFPQFSDNDASLIQSFAERKKQKIQKVIDFRNNASPNLQAKTIPTEIDEDGELVEEFDDDLISDDEFASFLNDEREIIVADTLYKYTYSGMFSVHKTEKNILDNYIQSNNIEYLIPDATTITRGVTNPTPEITKSIPTEAMIMESYNECGGYNDVGFAEFTVVDAFGEGDGCYSGGGGSSGGGSSGGSGSSTPVDHTASLVN